MRIIIEGDFVYEDLRELATIVKRAEHMDKEGLYLMLIEDRGMKSVESIALVKKLWREVKTKVEWEEWLQAYMKLHRMSTRDEAIESLIENYKAWNQRLGGI